MDEEKGYVAPPKKDAGNHQEYVVPPKKDEEYIAPPKMNSSQSSEYVAPPKGNQANHQAESTPKQSNETIGQSRESMDEIYTTDSADSFFKRYFHTPKVGWRFYVTGYLILMFLCYVPQTWENYRLANQLGGVTQGIPAFIKLLVLIGYILLSNYTYSWFSDYQRAKDGAFAWFFTPYGSVKAGMASSAFLNFQKGTVKRGIFGSYQVDSHASVGKSMLAMILIIIVTELLKFIVAIPLAFLSLFLHKRTIQKYSSLIEGTEIN